MEHYPETTVEIMRGEMTIAANESSLLECIGDADSFPPSLQSSPLSP